MNFALSQRRTDRHPAGLLIVVGLHVLLAGALLSARLVKPGPAEAPPIVLTPIDAAKPIERQAVDLPKPTQVVPRQWVALPTEIKSDPTPETIQVGKPDDRAVAPPTVVASAGDDHTVHEPVRVAARPAHIDVGAARCRPDYPAAAVRAGATGVSRIRFTVDATGRVSAAQIVQSSGATRENRMMDKAAAEALARCPVTAGTDEMGRPVGATTDVDYVWTLN